MKLFFNPDGDFLKDLPEEYGFELVQQHEAEAWVCNPYQKITKQHLLGMPNLKVIATPSTGMNHIPLDLCREYKIEVLTLADNRKALEEIRASSEFALLLILATLRNMQYAVGEAHVGRWNQHMRILRGNEVYQKKIGFVGYGRIARNLYKWLSAMDADIHKIYDPLVMVQDPEELDTVFKECDIVVIACSLTEDTLGMIDKRLIEMLPEGAVLINVARGEIINEKDLMEVLTKRPDLRVGVDVLAGEVSGAHLSSPIPKWTRALVTPHVAGLTYESNEKAARICLEMLASWGKML